MVCADIILLGTGSASHPLRNQSSVLIDSGEGAIMVDAGCGSWKTFFRLGYDLNYIKAVVVTHSHMDHVCSLAHILFLAGFKAPGHVIMVYTPGGIHREVVELLLSAGVSMSSSVYRIIEVEPGRVFEVEGVRVKPIPALHVEGSLSYALTVRGIRIVVSGDTAPNEALSREAVGADVVVHEATLPAGRGVEAVEAGHSSVDQAVKIASGAETLILYHLSVESEKSALRGDIGDRGDRGPRSIVVPQDGFVVKLC